MERKRLNPAALAAAFTLFAACAGEPFEPCPREPPAPSPREPVPVPAARPLRVVDDARVHLVFVPEGYRDDELDALAARATVLVEGVLAADARLLAPVRDHVAAWLVPLASRAARGAALRDADQDDTPLGGCIRADVDASGRLAVALDRVRAVVAAALPDVRVDATVVLMKTRGRPTTHDTIVLLGRGHGAGTLVHELGHALLGLGDEYADDDRCWSGPEPVFTTWPDPFAAANLTRDASGRKWSTLVRGAEPGGEGAGRCIYHPPGRCRMKDRRDAAWCPVCAGEVARFVAAVRDNDGPPRCDLALAREPDALVAREPLAVDVMGLDLDGVASLELALDGAVVFATTRAPSLAARAAYAATDVRVSAGRHALEVRCTDREGVVGRRVLTVYTR